MHCTRSRALGSAKNELRVWQSFRVIVHVFPKRPDRQTHPGALVGWIRFGRYRFQNHHSSQQSNTTTPIFTKAIIIYHECRMGCEGVLYGSRLCRWTHHGNHREAMPQGQSVPFDEWICLSSCCVILPMDNESFSLIKFKPGKQQTFE